MKLLLIWAVRVYRAILSPLLSALFAPMGLGCRFEPTCSEFALEALQCHGALKGSLLALHRLCRCHPWGGCGYDPVPPARPHRSHGCALTSRSPAPTP